MRISRINLLPVLILILAISLNACKTKKVAAKPVASVPAKENPPEEKPVSAPPVNEEKEEPAPVETPNYNFSNILFEFNSVVLKTGSYNVLDKVAGEMKKDQSVKFILNGHSSSEGSTEHNLSLSVDRANAVKSYLVNAGVDAANLTIKGYGETKPVASNNTEEGRSLNRRVEFKIVK